LTARLALVGLLLLALGVPAAGHSASSTGLIAFWSDRAGLPGVWVMKADGSSRKLLTAARSRSKRGDFSPSGRMLVFDGQPPSGDIFDFDIQVIRVDGRGRHRLTHGAARDLEPRWSPDGTTIAFQRQVGELGPRSIWTVPPAGGVATRLAAGFSPIWSPAGRRLLFSRETRGWGSDVYVMDADGSHVRLFFRSKEDDIPAAWNRRGVLLTRLSRTSPHGDVYVMRSGARAVERLTHCRAICYAADFSPDGRDILFTRVTTVVHSERGQVFAMGADGSKPRNLSRNSADENAESWAP
jgi:Tol biopolymer transport system component